MLDFLLKILLSECRFYLSVRRPGSLSVPNWIFFCFFFREMRIWMLVIWKHVELVNMSYWMLFMVLKNCG
jgi:hypothetical protein